MTPAEQILAELRTTNELLRRLLRQSTPHPVSVPTPPTLWETVPDEPDLADIADSDSAPGRPSTARMTGWHKVATANASRRWTPELLQAIETLWRLGFSDDEIADKLGRSSRAIASQRQRVGLVGKVRPSHV